MWLIILLHCILIYSTKILLFNYCSLFTPRIWNKCRTIHFFINAKLKFINIISYTYKFLQCSLIRAREVYQLICSFVLLNKHGFVIHKNYDGTSSYLSWMKLFMFILYDAKEALLLFKIRSVVLKSDSTGTLPALTQRYALVIADKILKGHIIIIYLFSLS